MTLTARTPPPPPSVFTTLDVCENEKRRRRRRKCRMSSSRTDTLGARAAYLRFEPHCEFSGLAGGAEVFWGGATFTDQSVSYRHTEKSDSKDVKQTFGGSGQPRDTRTSQPVRLTTIPSSPLKPLLAENHRNYIMALMNRSEMNREITSRSSQTSLILGTFLKS